MYVKNAFLYSKIEEEVYVCQPLGFEDPEFPNRVYKIEKELYGLHQALRAWYETLSTYLLDNGFNRGQIDKVLFIKRFKGDISLVQVYVDDIIFRSTRKELCTEFEKMIHKKFQMSFMRELTLFLGQPVKQSSMVGFGEMIQYNLTTGLVERAVSTAASLDADQASGNINRTQSTAMPNVTLPQGIGAGGSPRCQEATRGFIAQTRPERVPTPSYDSPFLGVHTLGSDEERFEQHELTGKMI
nr:uncharacterized mitochondrial protein AtMg00810-like [Tanacetum cinerariifolium]